MSFLPDDREHDNTLLGLLNMQTEVLKKIALSVDPAGALPVRLMGSGSQHVQINEAGELLVSDGPYDLAKFNEMDLVDTAYNFYGPNGRKQFVITGFLIYGDKQVNTSTNATVTIYEADQADSTTEDRVLVQVEVGQNQSIPFPNIRILCNKGVYLNAKTDDDDVHMTIFGHYVDLQGRGETNG
ncbi:hypothetical protein OAP25_02070 [Flavobacteriaceae bacterium]|nr:hypothetical protein [Flavobacteriaceae bacterium]